MNGAENLLRTLLANGIDMCLMNPGTSEMQFVSALDRAPAMRGVLCLVEGVCAGAADGYARMQRRPAATLLHLGPGLANGLSNFHNARKGRSPVVSVVGEHSTQHLLYNAPLTADIEALARPVSGWVRTAKRAADIGGDAAEAVRAAWTPPGQVATLIIPADFSWSEAGEPGGAAALPRPCAPAAERIREAARILRSGANAGIVLSGGALLSAGIEAAGRLAAATGVRVFADRFSARMTNGGGRFAPQRIAYFPEPAEAMLAGLEHAILVEAEPPVSFFGYPGRRSLLAPEGCAMFTLASPEEDGTAGLAALVEECGAGGCEPPSPQVSRPALPYGAPLTPDAVARAVAALLPEGAIISDETVSAGDRVWRQLAGAARHEHLPVTGGSIGQGLPVALGAALARSDRKVVALEADGSGMYSLQALWTMAREGVDVVAVIFANRRYRILEVEMQRTGAAEIGPLAGEMIDIGRPALDWVKLSEGLGVAATRATTADEFIAQFEVGMRERGPRLIEAVLAD